MTEAAARRAPLWTTAGGLCLLGGLAVALGPVLFVVAGTPDAPNSLGWYSLAGGALHTAAAALLGAALFARARHKAAQFVPLPTGGDATESGQGELTSTAAVTPTVTPTAAEIAKARAHKLALAAWSESGLVLLLAGVSVALRWRHWPQPGPIAYDLGLGVTALITCFPLLVLERRLAAAGAATAGPSGPGRAAELPDAAGVARVLRAVLLELACAGVYVLARRVGFESAIWVARVGAALGMVVAGELVLRALLRPLLPLGAVAQARSVVDSFASSVLLAKFGPARGLTDALRENFGVDLGRLWAMRFLRAAAAPLLVGLLLIAWLTTGMTALGPAERGVYERLGRPVVVFAPGLHLHLPWPFGAVRRTEFGVVHETPVAVEVDAPAETLTEVESEPPPSADRLWTQAHPTEGTYLIPGVVRDSASATEAKKTVVDLVTADLRVGWRVGLDDESARRALFMVADGAALVRALTGRLLVRDFATRPLEKIIGDDRDRLAGMLQRGLQQELDELKSGLEVTVVLVDAIHPPSKIAQSYHRVQAAEINAMSMISGARSQRARADADARTDAIDRVYAAEAKAGEKLAEARMGKAQFDADQVSFGEAGAALALERWLQTLEKTLVRCRYDLIDHRLELESGPTLDLRSFAPPTPPSGYE